MVEPTGLTARAFNPLVITFGIRPSQQISFAETRSHTRRRASDEK
jgi:hypothetical protein